MSFETIQTQRTQGGNVLEVSLNRPKVRNAFNPQVIEELTRCFKDAALDKSITMGVLRGEGSVFCAGADLNWMKESVEYSEAQNLDDTKCLARMLEALDQFPKPLLGVVQGGAVGGGVGLVASCDVVVTTSNAFFGFSEVHLGLIPACIAPLVIKKLGPSHARRFFLSGERFNGAKAKEIGLVHETVNSEEELGPFSQEMLVRMASCGPMAMQSAKGLIHELTSGSVKENEMDRAAQVLAKLRVTPEAQEGVRAFLEKRSPNWIS